MTSPPLLEMEGLTRAYPGVIANDDVTFSIGRSEVHALLGENGAGKSTLVKMVYGLVRPERGSMTFNGQPFLPATPHEARAAGVAMVFQHFSLFEALNVAENVALGMEKPPPMNRLQARIREVSETYGLPLDPRRLIGDLSAGERQRVEIIRCLLQDPKLLIMDEPTSVLTPQEVDILFATLRQLKDAGTSILYISHKLEEIRTLCDQATVLRQGKVVVRCDPGTTSAASLAEMMVGSKLAEAAPKDHPIGDIRLAVAGLSAPSATAFGTSLKDVTFDVRAGEILGIGGVAGNGRDELLAVLSGEQRVAAERVLLDGRPVGNLGPTERRKVGMLAAPEQRLGHAAAPGMSLTDNTLITARARKDLAPRGFIAHGKARRYADEVIASFDVRTPSTETMARALSGGNLQKFVIGREMLQDPDVLIVNQPTWGVDAKAAASIRQALLDLATRGAAVLVISQDLDELLQISTRFAALNEGRLSAPQDAASLSLDAIGLLLGGAHGMEVAHG